MAEPRTVDDGARPLIGVVGRRKQGSKIVDFPATHAAIDVDVFFADYARGVIEAGGLPVYLPLDVDPSGVVAQLDGIVLTGGADLDPTLWGAASETDRFPPEPSRDRFELAVLDQAEERQLPVLGICRGMQLLNVRDGGTLHQDVPAHARFDAAAGSVAHELAVQPGTMLSGLFGDRLHVNSLHHQTVDRLAAGWVVSATTSDGTIEAIEAPGRSVIGIQWHPELMPGRGNDPLFGWLVEEAREAGARRDGERPGRTTEVSWPGD
ncbi:MAG: gamma-glutamyl-gamma-aminobutyrate hydrolase family protein [Actinomycetota bacterium]|nr:gamma-glutamyl-gamma-aminobutyrate hydrolase family protein [Actinomycetota bacterium]